MKKSLMTDSLRQYVISIPIEKNWNSRCLMLKAAYGITAEEEKKLRDDPEYGLCMIFGDGEEDDDNEREEGKGEKDIHKKKA
jgi:hypothetical protein